MRHVVSIKNVPKKISARISAGFQQKMLYSCMILSLTVTMLFKEVDLILKVKDDFAEKYAPKENKVMEEVLEH